jgi:chorismate synthase
MFHFTTAGESHGRALVAIVEGLPADCQSILRKSIMSCGDGSKAMDAERA